MPLLLFLVELLVRLLDQLLERQGRVGSGRAHADAQLIGRVRLAVEPRECPVDAVAQRVDLVDVVRVGQNDELVAAVARDVDAVLEVAGAQPQGVGDADKGGVALNVPVGVVDALELGGASCAARSGASGTGR